MWELTSLIHFMKAFNLNIIQVGPQCILIYFIKIAKCGFLEETDKGQINSE